MIHLIGGGWGGDGAPWRGFLADAAARSGGRAPRIAVVAVRDGDAEEHAGRLVQVLRAAGDFEPVVLAIGEGEDLDPDPLTEGLSGVLVGGGLTPAYLDALAPHAERVRDLVGAGVPYAGFSAGSAIAATRAVVGGWRTAGVPVLDQDAGEGLVELAVRDGLGLVPGALDVHAAQWGTLARLVAAVGEGLVERGAAIDEDTALVLDGARTEVVGAGNVWWVEAGERGTAVVRRETAR